MITLEEKINEPQILKKLKKKFESFWGKDEPFQYIEDESLDMDVSDLTEQEIIEYIEVGGIFDIYDDNETASAYICKKCNSKYLSDEEPDYRHPEISSRTSFEIMDYCEDCRIDYLNIWT